MNRFFLVPVLSGLLLSGPATAQNNYLKGQQGPYRLSDVPEDMPSAPILDDDADTDHVDFAVTVDYRCASPGVATRTILSVADSSVSAKPERSEGREALVVTVPRSQLGSLTSEQACGDDLEPSPDSTADEPWALRHVPGAFAAYATLVCEDGEQEKIATGTASVPLDVWVRCPIVGEEATDEDSAHRDELALAGERPEGDGEAGEAD